MLYFKNFKPLNTLVLMAVAFWLASDIGYAVDVKSSSGSTINFYYEQWESLVAKYVKPNGLVDYVGIDKDYAKLKTHIESHKEINPKPLTEPQKKALYINLYNAGMIYNLLRYAKENQVSINSEKFTSLKINDIRISGDNIWEGNYKLPLGGLMLNLDEIEHGLLRLEKDGKYNAWKVEKLDPRIHTALNCAAISCPRVRETAYTDKNVEQLLEANIKEFLSANSQFKKLSNDKMQANSIVFWYYDDFDDYGEKILKQRGAGDYLAKYVKDTPDAEWKIKHLRENFNDRGKISLKLSSAFEFHYNWTVNDIRNLAMKK